MQGNCLLYQGVIQVIAFCVKGVFQVKAFFARELKNRGSRKQLSMSGSVPDKSLIYHVRR